MAAEVSSKVEYVAVPNIHTKTIVMTYSKASATDYITLATYAIKTVIFAKAVVDLAGADDPCTYADDVITLSTGTGASRALIVGTS